MQIISVIQQFRQSVYQILSKRADAALDFIDALTVAGHVSSPVALSEEVPFRRQFWVVFKPVEPVETLRWTLLPRLR